MGKVTAGAGSTKKAEILRMRYRAARMSLFILTAFSAINIFFVLIAHVTVYAPFSVTLPYGLVLLGLFWTGKLYTPEEYDAYFGMTPEELLSSDVIYIYIGCALVVLAVLVVCWALSKKHAWALIAGCALMALDTVSVPVFLGVDLNRGLTELLMHALAVGIMIAGIVAHYKLRIVEWMSEDPVRDADNTAAHPDTPALHAIDYSAKGKIIMIYDIEGYTVCYRRVGRIYELAVNKMVYDTVDAGPYEQPHELCAYVEGHEIMVGTSADTAYIRFDGEVIRKKQR